MANRIELAVFLMMWPNCRFIAATHPQSHQPIEFNLTHGSVGIERNAHASVFYYAYYDIIASECGDIMGIMLARDELMRNKLAIICEKYDRVVGNSKQLTPLTHSIWLVQAAVACEEISIEIGHTQTTDTVFCLSSQTCAHAMHILSSYEYKQLVLTTCCGV